jgi:hypothetical protein
MANFYVIAMANFCHGNTMANFCHGIAMANLPWQEFAMAFPFAMAKCRNAMVKHILPWQMQTFNAFFTKKY